MKLPRWAGQLFYQEVCFMSEVQLKKPLAKYIDHTLLKADATPAQIKKLCAEAEEYQFASVCVNSCYAKLAHECLRGRGVAVCCVVGFPLGAMSPRAMAYEARCAAEDGASEIDMVLPIGALKAGDDETVRETIGAVVEAVTGRAIVKVILEACLLTDAEKVRACQLAESVGAAFVKTSTGFSSGGATEHDVVLMRKSVSSAVQVKAAGGIRDRETALRMIAAGADRIGASAGIQIVSEG